MKIPSLIILLTVVALIFAGAYAVGKRMQQERTASIQSPSPVTSEDILCAQVITRAQNPATGEVRDFPTPCDVPAGWNTIR